MLTIRDANTPHQCFCFSAEDDENQADMQRFLTYVAKLPEIVHALQMTGHKYITKEFITTLQEKCRGVWIYLYYVLEEIKRGDRSPLDLADLPNGMTQYYGQYWQRWRIQIKDGERTIDPKWYQVYCPILATLAAAQEPVTIEQLVDWTNINAAIDELRYCFDEQWRPFLVITESGNQNFYRLYHATLREFFEGRIEQDDLSHQPPIMKELAKANHVAHSRLVDHYLDMWGKLEAGLPRLKEPQYRDHDNQYGLRYLTVHLEASGRITELHQLLRAEWVWNEELPYTRQGWRGWLDKFLDKQLTYQSIRHQNIWHAIRETVGQTEGYLADVSHAWQMSENLDVDEADLRASVHKKETSELNWQNKYIGLQCRYALIIATFNSHANNLRPDLLELVKKEIWLPTQGLAYAQRVPDRGRRAKILAALAPFLPDKGEQQTVFHEALMVARSIEGSRSRAHTLADLIPHLSQEEQQTVLQEALTVVRNIEYGDDQIKVLTNLAPYLAEQSNLWSVLEVVRSIADSYHRDRGLGLFAIHFAEGYPNQALAVARSIKDGYIRSGTLTRISSHLSPEEQQTVLQEALTVAHSVEDGYFRDRALADLTPYLAQYGDSEQALALIHSIEFSSTQDLALIKLAFYFADHGKSKQALTIAHSIRNNSYRKRALANLASRFAEHDHPMQTSAVARSIKSISNKAGVLATLSPHLSLGGRRTVFQETPAMVHSIKDSSERANALAELASYLPHKERQAIHHEALAVARSIESSYSRANALANLASHLPQEERQSLFQEALAEARAIKDNHKPTYALAKLALHFAEQNDPKQALTMALLIEDRYDQDKILISVAFYFAEHSDSKQALAVATAIEGRYPRDIALTNLASRLAEHGDPRQALTLANSIKDSYDRDRVLSNLAHHLPQQERHAVLHEALTSARSIWSIAYQSNIFTKLALHLVEHGDIEQALEITHSLKYSFDQGKAQAKFAIHLSKYGYFKQALDVARSINDSASRVKALADLAIHLPQEEREVVLHETLGSAHSIKHSSDRDSALAYLASYFTKLANYEQALDVARFIVDSASRVKALANLIIHLPQEERQSVLREALTVACSIEDSRKRADILVILTSHQIVFSQSDLYPLWDEALHVLSRRTRVNLLSDLVALSEAIFYLGGGSAISETAQAIQDVGRWWP